MTEPAETHCSTTTHVLSAADASPAHGRACMSGTLAELFGVRVGCSPGAVAVVGEGGREWSYGEL
ncbi:hypothetical protein, partial [Streptomyces sp. NPDC002889]|uniref:hypothetical protein n=1 Tax=Streptomyces sp. NPDC002889 TaxID=3364669 RepID=UPI0036B94F2D